jgi:hypothetical protein
MFTSSQSAFREALSVHFLVTFFLVWIRRTVHLGSAPNKPRVGSQYRVKADCWFPNQTLFNNTVDQEVHDGAQLQQFQTSR